MFQFKDRVVVITGASSGLGAQMAKAFAMQGANLVIIARRLELLEILANTLRETGIKCLPVSCDVTDSAMVNEVAQKVEEEFGKVDVLINCAGSSENAGAIFLASEEASYVTGSVLTIDGGYTAI